MFLTSLKKIQVPVVSHIFRSSLKLKASDAETVGLLVAVAWMGDFNFFLAWFDLLLPYL